jgi:glycine/D-amino acid oxidase-like deaminating enzyme
LLCINRAHGRFKSWTAGDHQEGKMTAASHESGANSIASQYDVVIVGGAVMGSSIAWHLAEALGGGKGILVVEKDMTYARSASALSAGSIRQQYSSAVNIEISLYGIGFMRDLANRLAVDGDRPEVGLREGGYLYVAGPEGAAVLAENQALQQQLGADILYLDPAALKQRFPYLAADDLVCGTWGRSGEGWFDGYGLMQAFRKAGRAAGVTYLQAEVAGLDRDGERVSAVRLADGRRIGCGVLVNAAGAAGNRKVAAMAGITIPVWGKKRSVFRFTARETLANFPLLIDTSGVWVRPEGDGYICGISPEDPHETDQAADFEVDWPQFEEIVWPALAARVPAFEEIRPGAAWAGHYDMNLFDHNAIVGRMGALENGYIAAGFSGHGLQQSPAVGRGLAELITQGRYVALDLGDLSFERLAANRPLLERNVI